VPIWFPIAGESLAVDLADSLHYERGAVTDGLASPEGLRDWLAAVAPRLGVKDGLDDTVDADLHASALALRDAVRAVLVAVAAGDDVPVDAIRTLNEASRAAPQWMELETADGRPPVAVSRPAASGRRALAAVAEDAIALVGGPDRSTVRACTAPGCVGLYLRADGRRRFCSPRCAARARAARHYEQVRLRRS
jgi:predicted RNA-binding Zn ribbon-like protein